MAQFARAAGQSNILRLILVGKTGHGKSSTGNTIAGRNAFKVSDDSNSETVECEKTTSIRDGKSIEVMDTPGLFDTDKTHADTALKLINDVMKEQSFAFIFVLSAAVKFSEEEFNAYKRLKNYFGEDFNHRLIVVFTHGDHLKKKKKTLRKYLESAGPSLQTVLRECQDRAYLFDNEEENTDQQVHDLLSAVETLLKVSDGSSKPSHLKTVEEIIKIVRKAEKEEVKHKDYVQEIIMEKEQARANEREAERKQEEASERAREAKRKQEEANEREREAERKQEEANERARNAERREEEADERAREAKRREEDNEKAREAERREEEAKERRRKAILVGALTGASSGATSGAIIGTEFGPLGTIVGSVIGTAVGAASGAIVGKTGSFK